jgi:hypothetical protein
MVDLKRCSNDERRFDYCTAKIRTLKGLLVRINEGYFDATARSKGLLNAKSSSAKPQAAVDLSNKNLQGGTSSQKIVPAEGDEDDVEAIE